jgi:DNA-binding protein Fis
MITLLIAEDELRVREALEKMLAQEGYAFSGSAEAGNVIRVVKKDCIRDLAFIKDEVIAFEEALFNEKKGVLYKSIVEAIEKPLIEQTLERTEGNQLKAARILGLNRNTLRAKIKKLDIKLDRYKQ